LVFLAMATAGRIIRIYSLTYNLGEKVGNFVCHKVGNFA